MRTLITVKNIRKSSETAKIGNAVNAAGNPITAKIVVFGGRLHYRLSDAYGAVNPNFSAYNSNFNPAIHAEIRASKHATGTVICTNYGVYVDIVALKHMLKDHFIDRTSGRNGRVHDVGDGDALDTLLQQHDSTGTGFENAVGRLTDADLCEIDPARLFYSRNIPTEKQLTAKRKQANNTTKALTVKPTPNTEYSVSDKQTPITVEAVQGVHEEVADDKATECIPQHSPIVDAGLKSLLELSAAKPESYSAISKLIDKLCDGKKLSVTLSVSLD